MIAAVAITLVAIATVFGFARSHRPAPAHVVLDAVAAPQADGPECQTLLSALPERLGDYPRAPTADPTPPGAVAWRAQSAPVVLRCGIDRPADFVVGSPIQMVNGVQWFQMPPDDDAASTWLCVDRPVYVALTLPSGSGPTPIQVVSDTIERTTPAVAIRPAPAR